MKGIIDTSSLLAIARYYLPFDSNSKLKGELQTLFDSAQIVVVDKVLDESKFIAKKAIPLGLPFIFNQPRKIISTASVLPNATFFNELETSYCNQNVRTRTNVSPVEFANRKQEYLRGADAKQIIYALSIHASNPVIVTEESGHENDGKLFKKIPSICSLAGVDCCTVPEFLKNYCGLNLGNLLK